jgi:hypothetical protein
LDANDSGQKQAGKDQNAQNDERKKIVAHGKPDQTAETSVVHWPGNCGHPCDQEQEGYHSDTDCRIPLAARSESFGPKRSPGHLNTKHQGDVSN